MHSEAIRVPGCPGICVISVIAVQAASLCIELHPVSNDATGDEGASFASSARDNGALSFDDTAPQTAVNTIIGAGTLMQTGAGAIILTGVNTYSGLTTVSPATALQVGNGGATGSLRAGNVTDNGALVFNHSAILTLVNCIGGAGSLTQAGALRSSRIRPARRRPTPSPAPAALPRRGRPVRVRFQ